MTKRFRLIALVIVVVLSGALFDTKYRGRAQASGVGTLAFVADDGQSRALYTIDTDGANFRDLGYVVSSTAIASIAWSPDGKSLAFIDSTTFELTILDMAGSPPRVLKTSIPDRATFAWSPDGKAITTINIATGTVNNIDFDTGKSALLFSIPQQQALLVALEWSPDGRHLLYIVEPKLTDELHVVDADGTNDRIVATGSTRAVVWSADSAGLFYLGKFTDHEGLIALTLADGKQTLVTALGSFGFPLASADDNSQFVYAIGNAGQSDLTVISANGRDTYKLPLPGALSDKRVRIIGIAWRPGTGRGGIAANLSIRPTATPDILSKLPTATPGGSKQQIVAGIESRLSAADSAFYAKYSTVQAWKDLLDKALLNYAAALALIDQNQDVSDFAKEPDRTAFQLLRYRALAGKARTQVRQAYTSGRDAYLEYVALQTPHNSTIPFSVSDTRLLRNDLEAAAKLGASFATPPKELAWVYYNWALLQFSMGSTYGLDAGITNQSLDDLYDAYQHYGMAGELLRTVGPELAYHEMYYNRAVLAYGFIDTAKRDASGTFRGQTALQWWKAQIANYAISFGQKGAGCGSGYGANAREYSQGIENGVFADPDGKTLVQWLEEQANYCRDVPLSAGYIYLATAQARLAWATRDAVLAQSVLTQADTVNLLDITTNFYGGSSPDALILQHNFGKLYLLTGNPLRAFDLLTAVKQQIEQYSTLPFSASDAANIIPIGVLRKVQFGFDTEWLIGRAEIQLGRYRDAIGQLRGLDALIPNYPQNGMYADSQEDLAQAYLGLNRYQEAIAPLDNARRAFDVRLQAALTKKDTDAAKLARIGLIDATLRLSIPLAVLGRTEQAVTTLQTALDQANQTDDLVLRIDTTLRVADVFLQLEKDDDALRSYQAVIPLAIAAKQPRQQGRAQLGIGQILLRRGVFDQAASALNSANQAAQLAKDAEAQVGALTALGDLALQSKADRKTAQNSYIQALTVAKTSKNVRLSVQPQIALADSQVADAPLTATLTYYRALSAALQVDNREAQAQIYARLGKLAAARGDQASADSAYRESIRVIEQAQRGFRSESLTSQFAANYAPVYANYLKLLVDRKRYADAFTIGEQARARAFLDQLSTGPIDYRNTASAALVDKERDLRIQLDVLRGYQAQAQAADKPDQAYLSQLRTLIDDGEREYGQVFTRLQAESSGSLATVATLSSEQVQKLLDADTTLISYYTTDAGTYVFIIRPDSLETVALPATQAQLGASVRLFRDDAKQARGMKDLGIAILTPILDRINTRHVIIVPHNVLNYIPFAALPLADGSLFGDKFTISYLPSASTLQYLAKLPDKPGPLLAFGNPAAPDQPPLKFAEDEVTQAVAMTGGQAFTGKDATVEVVQRQATAAGTLYFAAHGTFNARSPLFSALHLAPTATDQTGLLEAHQVYGLDLTKSTQLVVLSACDTAVGTLSAGDEFTGLNRAFLYAGSPAVIASLWSVDDKATGILMKAFFAARAKGDSNAQALQNAQRVVRDYQENGQTPYASPYYWAAFILTSK